MSPVALAVKRDAIMRDLQAGLFASEVAAKHCVAKTLVRQLVFDPEACHICDKCCGRGMLEGALGSTPACDKCKGGGYVCPQDSP